MKKILFLLFLSYISFTHSIFVNVEDDIDNKGKILISASTDNGESAAHEVVYLLSDLAYDGMEEVFLEEGGEDFHNKLILYKGELGEDEKLSIVKPNVKRYTILIFSGIDHAFSKKGISLKKDEIENWSKLIEKEKEFLGKYYELMKGNK